jgi:hypothetical protein
MLRRAERLYAEGFAEHASRIARAVCDEAYREREHHRLGTSERWACTVVAARSSGALYRFFGMTATGIDSGMAADASRVDSRQAASSKAG